MQGLPKRDPAVKIKNPEEKAFFDSVFLPEIEMLQEILLMLCSGPEVRGIVLVQGLSKLIDLFYLFILFIIIELFPFPNADIGIFPLLSSLAFSQVIGFYVLPDGFLRG